MFGLVAPNLATRKTISIKIFIGQHTVETITGLV